MRDRATGPGKETANRADRKYQDRAFCSGAECGRMGDWEKTVESGEINHDTKRLGKRQ